MLDKADLGAESTYVPQPGQPMATMAVTQAQAAPPSIDASRQRFQQNLSALSDNVSRAMVISERSLRCLLLALVCRGHLLLEDTPGVGKTLAAKTLARSIRGKFSRVQCTPDLLPSDITGTSVYRMSDGQFEFKPGPIFAHVLVADEINRAGPRTQSAFLEAMAEHQVTADGVELPLPRPFIVIATQNVAESHGVFPLPDSQLDRFLISMSLGLPSPSQEIEILSRAEHGLVDVGPVVTCEDVVSMQEVVRSVNVAAPIKEYLVRLAGASRDHPAAIRGASPRGTVLLQQAAQGWATFEGRDFVIPDDVKAVAPMVLPHRLAAASASGTTSADIVEEVLDAVPVPA